MEEILELISGMDPESALKEIAKGLKVIFPLLDEAARTRFL